MHYYVVGINASGKTTLLQAVSKQTGIPVVHGTQELMKTLGITGDYNALRAMNQDEVLVKWSETAERLLKEFGPKPFMLDAHILNLTRGKVIRRDGPWIGDYDALVMIKSNPAVIFDRLEHDTKDRALFTLDFGNEAKLTLLTEYQAQTEKIVKHLSQKYELPLKIIENHDLDKATAEFVAFHRSFGSLESESNSN